MINRDVFLIDPSTRKLVNEGVASVNDDLTTQEALDILRYELETFVCDGQYHKGLEHILNIFLGNTNQPTQPAVWVSGFYGSGKSHLVKMLRALWVNTRFDDGATARGIAHLPEDIKAHLTELDNQGKRHGGGLHAASGTLGSMGYEAVRPSFLSIVFKSLGLPERIQVARFVLYLKGQGLLEEMKAFVNSFSGSKGWDYELHNFYASDALYEGYSKLRPGRFATQDAWTDYLLNQYPHVNDISSADVVEVLGDALKRDGKFPLTLIVIDEVQQYVGPSPDRLKDLQEIVETCCQQLGGKLLFIGTGQTAITHTENLKKLEGRFTVRVELSDTDVDAVLRKVVLAKKPEANPELEKVLEKNLGEVSRHLQGTTLAHRAADIENFAKDYPILPARRRFWEAALKALDPTGTDSQLRNQLGMVHKAVQSGLDLPVGNVVKADFLFFDQANRLLQSSILPRLVHEKTLKWIEGTPQEQLMARCCGLAFLIGKMPKDVGLQATADVLADLLVEDINAGSGSLRSTLPALLNKCDLLIKVGDEFRIQTPESVDYNELLRNQRNELANQTYKVDTERSERIRGRFAELGKKLSLTHGASKESRTISPCFDAVLPNDSGKRIYAWIRDGWNTDESTVLADARQAGNQSPTVFVFIPKRQADDLRNNIIDFRAAKATLELKEAPSTNEGRDARMHIETIRQAAEQRITEILDGVYSDARVFQAGGSEVSGDSLVEMILEAAKSSLARLFPKFSEADNANWGKVYERASKGATDALSAIGFQGEVPGNSVCKSILGFIGGGKKGTDIREHFTAPPFGWPKDAIDGGLQVLLVAGHIRAKDDRGNQIKPNDLERRDIGKTAFLVETKTVSVEQKLLVKKLLQKAECPYKAGDEISATPTFIDKLMKMAANAGGEVPKPEKPTTLIIEELKSASGNELLVMIATKHDELDKMIDAWTALKKSIEARWPGWTTLKDLIFHVDALRDAEVYRAQVEAIEAQRSLLDEPDPVTPLVFSVAAVLREELVRLAHNYEEKYKQGMERLQDDQNWNKLEPEQRREFLSKHNLAETDKPGVKVEDTTAVLATLRVLPISAFRDRVDALLERFDRVLAEAAALLEPEVTSVSLPKHVLKNSADLESWLNQVREQLEKALGKGPVRIK